MIFETYKFSERKSNEKLLLNKYLNSEVSPEVYCLLSLIERKLKENQVPVLSISPLMSLQGKWALNRLMGEEKGYGDIDWGVIIDCPIMMEKEYLKKINDIGNKFIDDANEISCKYINPLSYFLNFSDIKNICRELPGMCSSYCRNDSNSFNFIVCASLPLMSGKKFLYDRYLGELKKYLDESEFIMVFDTLQKCCSWMKKYTKQKNSTISPYLLRELELVKNEGNIPDLEIERSSGASYGLLAVKPNGMSEDILEIVPFLLDNNVIKNDNYYSVLESVLYGMTVKEREFFTEILAKVKICLFKYGNYSEGDSFWIETYKKRHENKFWYKDLLDQVNKGTLCVYLLKADVSQKILDTWIDLFKGRENIVKNDFGSDEKVVRSGKGIRGLKNSEAVMVSKEKMLSVEENGSDNEYLFSDLSNRQAGFLWDSLTRDEKNKMLGNSLHATSNIRETFDGIKNILSRDLGKDFIYKLEKCKVSDAKKIEMLVSVHDLVFAAKEREEKRKMSHIYPSDFSLDKKNFSYGMYVVKPTGMSHDFSEILNYLFDARNRKDDFFAELSSYLSSSYESDYREEFCYVLENTYLDCNIFDSFEPGRFPLFWEANYQKKSQKKFFYQSILDGFKGGKNVEIFILRSLLPQPVLDEWMKKLKGRETLFNYSVGQKQKTLFQGYGLRGIVDVQAIMLDRDKLDNLMSHLSKEEQQFVLNEISAIQLPIIFSRLPEKVQAIFWNFLPKAEQQALISNFIHSPDNIETTSCAIMSLMKKYLTQNEIDSIMVSSEGRENIMIFDFVTKIIQQRISKYLICNNGTLKIFPGNSRATFSQMKS